MLQWNNSIYVHFSQMNWTLTHAQLVLHQPMLHMEYTVQLSSLLTTLHLLTIAYSWLMQQHTDVHRIQAHLTD